MCVAFRSGLWCTTIAAFVYGTALSPGWAVELPGGNTQIVLQNAYPGESTFTVQSGMSIISNDTPIVGDNSQNWHITNYGTLTATTVSTASGIQLGAATENFAIVINYGTITSAGTSSSSASGIRFTNGGQVTNQAGATISGLDGVHTDGGSVLVNNYGTIMGSGATGVYSGVGARINNYETGVIDSTALGISCNGAGQCIVDNRGYIHGNNIALNFIGTNRYSLRNEPTGTIAAGNQAVRFSGSDGQILNEGMIRSTNSTAVGTESDGSTYVNTGTMQGGGSNGSAFVLTGNGNLIYNLGTMTGVNTAISLTGNDNTLVLGTHAFLPLLGIDVFGPGSSITGAITASGTNNAILLHETGSEDTPFTGFASLAMDGSNWVLSNSFMLLGTSPDSLAVRAGTLTLNGIVATAGGATISGGVLLVGDIDNPSATLTVPGGATVNSGGTLGGSGVLVGNVANGGTLTTAALSTGRRSAFTIQGDVTNSGLILLAAGAPGNTLTLTGNLISSGGRLTINTALGGDNSPTDLLILDGGTTTGTTSVIVQSTGTGDGMATTIGIRVVQTINGATTAASSFALSPASPGYRATIGTIAAGAFDYSLTRGGRGGVADDWYLTSLTAPTPPDNGGGGGQPSRRIYRPEGGLYLTNEAVARTMFSMTLHDREGYDHTGIGTAPSGAASWARVTGNRLNGEVAGGSLKLSADSVTAQVGTDLWRFDSNTYGSFRAGVMGGYGAADTSTSSRLLANYKANGDVTGYSVGVYGTWWQNGKGETGAYVDTWAQYNWFNNEIRGSGLSKETYDAHAFSASIEAGYKFELMRTSAWRVHIEPQIQAIYTDYSADSLTERGGTSVRFQNGGWATFRVGGRLSGTYTFADGNVLRPYLEVNLWRNTETVTLMLNRDAVRPDLPKTFGEIKIGAQGTFGKNWSVWGQVSALGGEKHFRQYGGQVGLKYVW